MSDDTFDLFGPAARDTTPSRPRTGMDAAFPVPGKRRETMARNSDPAASHRTADAFPDATLSHLQRRVLAAIAACQPIHALDLETLPEFDADYAPSTVRKRVTELVRAGLVVAHDEVRVGRSTLTRWRLADGVTLPRTEAA